VPLPVESNKDDNEMLPYSSIFIALRIAFLIYNNQDSNGMKASASIAHFIGFLIESNKELKEIWASSSSISCCIALLIENAKDSNRTKVSSSISHFIGFIVDSNKELKGLCASSSSSITSCALNSY
jgi:predicted neutral ceramidase superfamily lipid hydrolase